jgi:hypothetical protein
MALVSTQTKKSRGGGGAMRNADSLTAISE